MPKTISDAVRDALVGVAIPDQARGAILALCGALDLAERYADPGLNDHTGRDAAADQCSRIFNALLGGPVGWWLAHHRGSALSVAADLDDPAYGEAGSAWLEPAAALIDDIRTGLLIQQAHLAVKMPALFQPGTSDLIAFSSLVYAATGRGVGALAPPVTSKRGGQVLVPLVGPIARAMFCEAVEFHGHRVAAPMKAIQAGHKVLAASGVARTTRAEWARNLAHPAAMEAAREAGAAIHEGREPTGNGARWLYNAQRLGIDQPDFPWKALLDGTA